MKKVFFLFTNLLVIFFVLNSCENIEDNLSNDNTIQKEKSFNFDSKIIVGKLIDDKPIITFDQKKILDAYNKNIKNHIKQNQGIDVIFDHCYIEKLNIENSNNYYGLFVFNKSETVRAITVLEFNNSYFKVYIADNGGSITCTTTACSNNSGCTAIQKTNSFGITYWTCSDCYDGKCTKTTTVTFK